MELSIISYASRPPLYDSQQTTHILHWNSSLSSRQQAISLLQSADCISTLMELSIISYASRPPLYDSQQTTPILHWNSLLSSRQQAISLLQSADYTSTTIHVPIIRYATVPQSADFMSTPLTRSIITQASRPRPHYNQNSQNCLYTIGSNKTRRRRHPQSATACRSLFHHSFP